MTTPASWAQNQKKPAADECAAPVAAPTKDVEVVIEAYRETELATSWAYATTALLQNWIKINKGLDLSISSEAMIYHYIVEMIDRVPTPFNKGGANLNGVEGLNALLNPGIDPSMALEIYQRHGIHTRYHYSFLLDSPLGIRESLKKLLKDLDVLNRSSAGDPVKYPLAWIKRWQMDRLDKIVHSLPATLSPAYLGESDPVKLLQKVMGPEGLSQLKFVDLFTRSSEAPGLPVNWVEEKKLREGDKANSLRRWMAHRKVMNLLARKAGTEAELKALDQEMKRNIDEHRVLLASIYWMKKLSLKSSRLDPKYEEVEDLEALAEGLSYLHNVVVTGYRLDAHGAISHWRVQEGRIHTLGVTTQWVSTDFLHRRLVRVRRLDLVPSSK